jgi:hypothetical protein
MANESEIIEKVTEYVSTNIGGFHSARLTSLANLSLEKVLKRKNPYLFKAKNLLTSETFIKYILDAHLSSQEETMFGEFLEELAIYICHEVYNGEKSAAEGIDLEFTKGEVKYLVAIKSGPNWGNSSQIKKMREHFRQAHRILNTSTRAGNRPQIIAINGCCYGKEPNPDKGDYIKYCGQEFWSFISGEEDLYIKIMQPLGNKAKEKNDEFNEAYAEIVNRFTTEFSAKFCSNNKIDWEKLVTFNSKKI